MSISSLVGKLSFGAIGSRSVSAAALATITSIFLLRKLLRPEPGCHLLVSLPYSHFVELARWSLSMRGHKYVEIKVPLGPHTLIVPFYRLLFGLGSSSKSSLPGLTPEAKAVWSPLQMQPRFLRGLMGLPFVVGNDRSYNDSWSVLKMTGMTVTPDFQLLLDEVLAPSLRQFAYTHIFEHNFEFYRDIQSGVSPQRGMWFLMLCHDAFERVFFVSTFMKSLLALHAHQVAGAQDRVLGCFDVADEVLFKHKFLGDGTGGDAFGGGDLAFSALAGWLVLPEKFGGGEIGARFLKEENFGETFIEFRARLKGRASFEHVAKMYDAYR